MPATVTSNYSITKAGNWELFLRLTVPYRLDMNIT